MKTENQYNRRTINGRTVGCSRCTGYCRYTGHPGYLTEKLQKEHQCLEKGCHYYEAKEKTIRRKDRDEEERAQMQRVIMQEARSATKQYEGMKVTGVSNNSSGHCELRYVTISNSYPIRKIEQFLEDVLGMTVSMKKINCDYETAVNVIFAG